MKSIIKQSIAFAAFLLPLAVCAQNEESVPFNGIVSDAAGMPLKNVKIWVHDSKRYARSNKEGKFGLTNVNATDTLHVKYDKTIYNVPVDGKKAIRLKLGDKLSFNSSDDEELVNVGYGFVKKREATISSSGVTGEQLVRTGKTDLLDALQGLVAGLYVSNGRAIIRGVGTINASTDPLYIVDGVEVQSLSIVNLYDVARVDVLKDGSMYGSRGANGVILVTTKRGSK